MKTLLLLFLGTLAIQAIQANPELFRESFGDPATRTEAIATLTPGTRDHYFYTALNHQLNRQEKEYREVITAWTAAAERKKNAISSEGIETLETRRILKQYDQNPKAALKELIQSQDLEFDDTRPDSAAEEEALPTKLDPKQISTDAFREKAKQDKPYVSYSLYSQEALYSELNELKSFNETRIRWFFTNFKLTQHPNYTTLVTKALALKAPMQIDSINLDSLTLAQMDAIRKTMPAVISNNRYNLAYFNKLRPATTAIPRRDTKIHAAFLASCRDYALTLPPSQNSLKAFILHHHLRLQEKLGKYPKSDFLTYLELPRRHHQIIRPTKDSKYYVSRNSDLTPITECQPISDDTALIDSYLNHFLSLSDTLDKKLVPLIQEKPLAIKHARARILAGADPKLYAPRLDAESYRELREETRINFAPTVPLSFSATDKVSLPLNLKNTPSLLIRIYELQSKPISDEVNASADLDGLVPHHTRNLRFKQPAPVQHRENIELPELDGAGSWIVEFVSGRISARALIRKGNITPYITRTANGQEVRLFDEKSQPIADFTINLGSETFTSSDGVITVPNAANQPRSSGTISAINLTEKLKLKSREDRIKLDTTFLLDREQLLANQTSTLHLRSQLTNHGHTIPIDKVENATLVLKAKLLGGVTTERVIADPLILAETNKIPFLVPADLLSLTVTISGTVTPETSPIPVTLNQSHQFNLNGMLLSDRIGSALFSPTDSGYRVDLRGRNGEALPKRPVSLTLSHKDFNTFITVRLRSDDAGRIALGALNNITQVILSSASTEKVMFSPPSRKVEIPNQYKIPQNRELRIPMTTPAATINPANITLHRCAETSYRTPVIKDDLSSKLTVDSSHLVVKNLTPGNYRLIQDDAVTMIDVFPTKDLRGELLVTEDEIQPVIHPSTPTIISAKASGKSLSINLAHTSPQTRVTVIGKRYEITGWSPGLAAFPYQTTPPPHLTRGTRPSAYVTDRRLSDEMRYILDRRSADIFPGVMLPRPGQLLYRWTSDDLDQDDQTSRYEEDGDGFAGDRRGLKSVPSAMRSRKSGPSNNLQSVLDFLEFPAAVEFNLTPDAQGKVVVPLASLLGAQFIEIIAADTSASDTLYLPLPASDTPIRDRRLARPLPTNSHHIATRSAASLAPGAEVEIQNLLDADWRAFTTLSEAYQFLLGTIDEDELRSFSFLTSWPSLNEKEKLKLLAAHHCHELHLFLARKDKDFFEKNVKPFLVAKPQPQFIDDYLLERDLSAYLRPYAFSRLNAAEKALIAQALPASQKTIARELDLRWQLEAPSPDAETVLFSQTLKGADLSSSDSLGLASNVHLTGQLLALAQGNYNLGKYDNAKSNYLAVLRTDPYNTAARRGLERVAAIKSDYYRAAYDHTRSELLMEVDNAWELDSSVSNIVTAGNRSGDFAISRNSIDAILNNPNLASSEDGSSHGNAYITEKLRRIIIPNINFENVTLEEAVAFLRQRSTELDTLELDPSRKGMSFVIRNANASGIIIPELKVRNVPLSVALKYICDATKMRYKVDDYAITLVPQTDSGEDLFTRTFNVPPDFLASLTSGGGYANDADPFADPETGSHNTLSPRMTITNALQSAGITLPEGASATLVGNKLLISNTPTELDKIESLVDAVGSNDAGLAAAYPRTIGGLIPDSGPRTFPNRTHLWKESNYYRNDDSTDEDLIPLNRFWLELASWDGKGQFTSPHFNACTENANDALMCLAMLDLPFTAKKPEVSVDANTLKVKALAPMLLFYKDTRETNKIAAESPLLVRQSYHPLAEPFLTVDGKRVENTHIGDFRTGTAYGVSLVITNPSGIERRIETLAQIPAGSIPLATCVSPPDGPISVDDLRRLASDAPSTLSTSHDLPPYGVIRLQLAFYFPAAGDYTAYPLHVSENATILAFAQPRTLRVSAEPAPEDSASWEVLARDGSADAVLNRLLTVNLETIDLDQILWRLRDKEFFLKTTAILRQRLWFAEDVFAYSILHNDPATLSDLIENSDLVESLGSWFNSKLITITPTMHHGWETLEFDPLINARAHIFGENPYISHANAREYYQEYLDTLAWKPELSASDQLTLTCFLFLQDRVGEALARFEKIKPAALPDRMQYDYLHAVALFHQEKPEEAKAIAQPYTTKLPQGQWQDRFNAVIAQADEIARPIAAAPTEKKDTTPTLEISHQADDSSMLLFKHTNLNKAAIRLYHIDLEVLFSKDPFLNGGVESSLPPIAPNLTVEVPFKKDTTSTSYALPEEFRNGNILVAAESDNVKQLKILDSQSIEIRTNPAERTIQVIDTATGKPLPKSYIKIYSESTGRSTDFHKDGYTDLRGKFDYLSHTAKDPSDIRRLAILISHPEKGSRTLVIDR